MRNKHTLENSKYLVSPQLPVFSALGKLEVSETLFSHLPPVSLQECSSLLPPPVSLWRTHLYFSLYCNSQLSLPGVPVDSTECEKGSVISIRLGSVVLCLVFQVSSIPIAVVVAKYPSKAAQGEKVCLGSQFLRSISCDTVNFLTL